MAKGKILIGVAQASYVVVTTEQEIVFSAWGLTERAIERSRKRSTE